MFFSKVFVMKSIEIKALFSRKPSLSDNGSKNSSTEISTILFVHKQIWVGTSDGYLIIYRIRDAETMREITNECILQNQK